LSRRKLGTGNAATSREYAAVHSSAATASAVWGACRSTESSAEISPFATASISPRIEIMALMKRSSSVRSSDSVGSTMSVPATGQDIVGA